MKDHPVADRVRALRVHLGLSQTDVARAGGTDVDNIKKVEAGRNQVSSLDRAESLARGFGLTVNDLRAYLDGDLTVEQTVERRGRTPGVPQAPTQLEPSREPPPQPDLDEALARAFRSSNRFTLADIDAVRKTIAGAQALRRPVADLDHAALRFLEAAADLRARGEPVTILALVFELATDGEREAIRARSAALNDAGDRELHRVTPAAKG